MTNLSSHTITLLFTDIEGSTKLWEEHPEAMRLALARHDALIREGVESNHGKVFKTIGDAFCAAFADPQKAVETAIIVQQGLVEMRVANQPLKVRMALHTGVVEERDGDYFGQPLNRVARLLSAGHGGQILLSQAMQEAISSSLPSGMILRDRGARRLKDLVQPEHIFQLEVFGLETEFPPLRTLDARAHNLPAPTTTFVGRTRETSELKERLKNTRLLTLTGIGGGGKTRLALQVAADHIDDFREGVFFIELAPLTDNSQVVQTVADTLALREEAQTPLLTTVLSYLREKQILLLLDNCEHVVDACAWLCQQLIVSCPGVRVLASSREPLRIPGEVVYPVPSLTIPDPTRDTTPERLLSFETVRLFLERATQVQPAFAVTSANAPTLASVCHRLDGIPLAIELAAARVRSLSIEDINGKLDQRFRLLTGGSRTALPRQQTLRSLIDWSYDLLTDTEKVLLARLSVFSGGWALESAESVGSGDPLEDWEVLDLLTSLVDKSLVMAESKEEATRYRLLETVRQYARERLETSGEADAVHTRHQDYFVRLSEEAGPLLMSPEQKTWLARLEQEQENFRAAMEWSLSDDKSVEPALRLCGMIWRFWLLRGYLTEGRVWCERALEKANRADSDEHSGNKAKVLNGAGSLAVNQGDYTLARRYYDQCLAIARAQEFPRGIASALNNLGGLAIVEGDFALAGKYLKESVVINREIGERWNVAGSLDNLGWVTRGLGDYDSANRYLEESLALYRDLGDRYGIGNALNTLGMVACDLGDSAAARPYFEKSLELFQEIGDRPGIVLALANFGNVSRIEKRDEQAALLWGAAEVLGEEIHSLMLPADRDEHTRRVAAARDTLGEEAFARAWTEGRAFTMEQAIELALRGADHKLD
ncbi:tetratricopeptide repeat protein [Armatimonas sp.]|uniref:tetratricopeptide repeat protein n=1 Tax=Armatimonas sp. TaxID=1872638 RepID=UPI00286AA354|nr:tetratricopeptide repeat protein [Armatimonas sp.]